MKITVKVRKTTKEEKIKGIINLTLLMGIIFYYIQRKKQG